MVEIDIISVEIENVLLYKCQEPKSIAIEDYYWFICCGSRLNWYLDMSNTYSMEIYMRFLNWMMAHGFDLFSIFLDLFLKFISNWNPHIAFQYCNQYLHVFFFYLPFFFQIESRYIESTVDEKQFEHTF